MGELRFENVTVRFGTGAAGMIAVDDVSLVVPAGRTVGLVGESGSGKSTLGRAAVGITPLDTGRITFDAKPLRRGVAEGRIRPVQMVFQDPYASLDPRVSIRDSIAEAIPRRTMPRSAGRRREVVRLLELVGLDGDRATAYPGELSGGQRQRVALARALATGAQVIVADEITSALDVSVQGNVLNLVRDLQRRLGVSMLFISHNLAVVRYVSDTIAVMYLGRIVEQGPAERVLGDPQHPYTRDLIAAIPDPAADRLPLRVDDPALARLAEAEPPDPHAPPTGCAYHPRCPIGPLVNPDRTVCQTARPSGTGRVNAAACHFAAETLLVPR